MQLPRFYPILDVECARRYACDPEILAGALLEAGVKLLQFRHKEHYTRDVFACAERIAQLCHRAGAALVIDDRADIAILLDAGVHVGQDDLAPQDARRLVGPDRLLGFSTHTETQFRAAQSAPADYLALGPIFATGSKRNPDPVVGVEEVRRLRPLDPRPLVAIGGITRENAARVLAAGANAVAVVSDLFPATVTADSLHRRAEVWVAATSVET
ncbi:MAG: thiamine phosphate synthase [Bryobacteraceae bacterium]